MKGIEKLPARLPADAQAEAAEILRAAREKAAESRAGYEAQAGREAAAAAQSRERAVQQRLERLESAAEMEARRQLLAAKQDCIDEAFARAKAELLALPEDQYAKLLAKLAAKASQTGREEILLSPRDRERVGTKVVAQANALLAQAAAPDLPEELQASRAGSVIAKVVTGASALLQGTAMLTLSDETRDIEGGLILRSGHVEINCAFETQLRMLRETMAAEIAAVLFA